MEINEFDQFIRSKLADSKAHEKELSEAQPYLWSSIQEGTNAPKKESKWIYFAAASFFILFSLGAVWFWQMRQSHISEMASLKKELQFLKHQKDAQANTIGAKNAELIAIRKSLNQLEKRIDQQYKPTAKNQVETIYITQKDTVYLEKVLNTPSEQITKMDSEDQSLDSLNESVKINKEVALFQHSKRSSRKENNGNNISLRLAQLPKP